MMMSIFYLVFMIPLIFIDYWVFHLIFLMFVFVFSFNFYFSFFCSLSYIFGLDNYSYWLVILSLIICSLMFISFNLCSNFNLVYFCFFNLFLFFILFIVFCSLNLFFMYVFFEFSLFPLMVIIFGWGYQPERLISGFYLFFYTLFASLPLLILIIYFYNFSSMFFDLVGLKSISFIFFFCSIFAFLVKFPMFMFHFWLPKAHVQAPVFGSMVLAGLLLKMGGYGIIRFLFMVEWMYFYYGYIWYSFCLVGCLTVSLVCFIQGDIKSMIANSSVSHMMMCIMGLLSMQKFGILGSFLMMLGHGLCSSGLFYISSIGYDRLFSRSFFIMKGFMNLNCSLMLFWFLLCCFNMGCPPSINFVSELMLISSIVFYWSNSFFLLIMLSFFTACFSFYLFSYSYHGLYFNSYSFFMVTIREYFILYIHILYLVIILMIMNFIV